MIALKLLATACFLFSWWRSKQSSSAQVSDFFILSFLIIFLPGYLFLPSGETTLNGLDLSDRSALAAEYGFSLALICGSGVFFLRRRLRPSAENLERKASVHSDPPTFFWSVSAITASLLIFAFLMLNAEFRDFKWNVLRYLTINLDGPEYRTLRGTTYYQSWVVESLVGRLRFTLYPILFCLIAYPIIIRKHYIFALISSIIFFVLLPGSLSKLPILFFSGYMILLLAQRRRALLDIETLTIVSIVSAGLAVGVLSLLYFGQYRLAIMNGTLQPVPLALERIWGEPYSIIVRYFTVYPDMKSFAGFGGINLIAQMIGVPVRMPDVEVARTLLGPDSGSNPGVFFVGGYAAFGYFGIVIFSFLGFGLLWILDEIQQLIQTPILRATYFSTVGMNVIFLNQIALQTALITYGLAVIPVVIFLLDRVARHLAKQ
ncbi:hypothetical protein [Rhizobium sp. WYJ-E13]|uniref:hypothetical protein n=1 Tax=Rhizobium sp. WYJ-E13 TaxID=2849093 RepID=UPI001C1EDEDA|nr:hypothetical protein [Rhizobium sp. WYJ-E13]QWW70882.1 hypothetical protein KQ933_29235 [Rhizobium sp. WYJ-E13]